MAEGIALIVGLGNPGSKYSDTRHNAGFRFLEALSRKTGVVLNAESRFKGDVGRAVIANRDVWLLVPQTYMNLSGDAVAALANFYKIPPESILVAHDDLDLAPGTARLKLGGGHGGHNGLRDIVAKLGSSDFARLRIGIGHPGAAKLVESYVLKHASVDDQIAIDNAIDAAVAEIDAIVTGQHADVMNRLHSR
jgi:PTH1 family peptidyl-tRNA hydrolase